MTIRQVALAAGVSPGTVSNVLNERPGAVGAAARAAVQQAIARLGYRPQAAARGLRQARHFAVGLLIVDDEKNYLADPFNGHVVAGWTDALNSRGYVGVLHGSPRRAVREAALIRRFGVDGLCAVVSGSERERRELLALLLGFGQPLALIQEHAPLPEGDLCVVRQDDFGGGRLVGQHLAARGCRELLMVLPRLAWPALQARLAGLRQAARTVTPGLRVTVLRAADESAAAVALAVRQHLAAHPRPDALVGGNDQVALAALQALRGLGLDAPRDLRVVGFNALGTAQLIAPVLSSVQAQARAIGEQAAIAMVERIESGSFSRRDTVLPVSWRQGESA